MQHGSCEILSHLRKRNAYQEEETCLAAAQHAAVRSAASLQKGWASRAPLCLCLCRPAAEIRAFAALSADPAQVGPICFPSMVNSLQLAKMSYVRVLAVEL